MGLGSTNALSAAASGGGTITIGGQEYTFKTEGCIDSIIVPITAPVWGQNNHAYDMDSTETYVFGLNTTTRLLTKYNRATSAVVTSSTITSPPTDFSYNGVMCHGDKVYVFARQYVSTNTWYMHVYSYAQSNLAYVATSPIIYNVYSSQMASIFFYNNVLAIPASSNIQFYNATTLAYTGNATGLTYIGTPNFLTSDGYLVGIGGAGSDSSSSTQYSYKVNMETRVGSVCVFNTSSFVLGLYQTPSYIIGLVGYTKSLMIYDKSTFLSASSSARPYVLDTLRLPNNLLGSGALTIGDYVCAIDDTKMLLHLEMYGITGQSAATGLAGDILALYNPSAQRIEDLFYSQYSGSWSISMPPRWVNYDNCYWLRKTPYDLGSIISPAQAFSKMTLGKKISSVLVPV